LIFTIGIKISHASSLAASPSLRFIDWEMIRNFVTITVNSSILKYPDCSYFVTDDHGVSSWNYWQKTARESKCIKFLYEDKLTNYVNHLDQRQIVFYKHRFWSTKINNLEVYHKDNLIMHDDPAIPIIGARSSIASAINIAYIMGCSPIILIGVDNCYENNKRYFWQFEGQPKAIEMHNRIFSCANKGVLRGKPVDHHCVDYDLYWQHFAEMNPHMLSGKIINSSVNGILNIFPKVDLKEMIKNFGDSVNV
jgi:hypothetical protein